MGSSVVRELGFPFGPRMMKRYEQRGGLVSQGISAEMIADQWDLSREDLDRYSAPQPAAGRPGHAPRAGSSNEIVPVAVRDDEGNDTDEIVTTDEGIRPDTTVETLADAQAGLQARGRQDHRRQLLADHRRGLGGADHERGEGRRPGPRPRGPGSTPSPWPAWTRSPCSPAPSRPPGPCSSGPS